MSILAALDRLLDDVTLLIRAESRCFRRSNGGCSWPSRSSGTRSMRPNSCPLLLKPNVVSAQISRLIAERYVERIGRGRPPRYRISERLFNIYWLMRQGGSGKRNLQLLLELLDSLVSNENVFALARRAIEEGVSQRIQTWSESITDLFYVSEVMSRTPDCIKRAELLLGLLLIAATAALEPRAPRWSASRLARSRSSSKNSRITRCQPLRKGAGSAHLATRGRVLVVSRRTRGRLVLPGLPALFRGSVRGGGARRDGDLAAGK